MNARPNAIETRLYRLYEQCRVFLEAPAARVLRWKIRDDERAMVSAFLAIEGGEHGGLPFLFLRCTEPFEDASSYAGALTKGLLEGYEASRAEFEADGYSAWQPPVSPPRASPAERWVDLCAAFHRHHAPRLEGVVAALMPSSDGDAAAFAAWIADVARIAPAAVRLIVPEAIDHPWLDPLTPLEQDLVLAVTADLGMPEALTDLAQNAADSDQPSGRFRSRFVALGNAAGKGDIAAAETSAEGALAIAASQGWLHLEVAVLCALASVYTAAQRPADALARYHQADTAACRLMASDETLGGKLRLNVQLSIGALLVGAGEHARAARVYEACAGLAQRIDDRVMQLEAWRMASWCHEQGRGWVRAWECGHQALEVAGQLDEQARQRTTLPYVGEGLIRIASQLDSRQIRGIEQRMQALTGRVDWRPAGQGASGA